jgi:ankyrin repeat protein
MKTNNKVGQNIKPEQIRYIILGNLPPESDFKKLKALCTSVHWIHMEGGSFLWRESNCNIDIIRRHIDDTNCKKYDMKDVMERNDRTMLLVAEPGMGKSTFLSYMEHEIKKWNLSMWVLRINLYEHTRVLENIELEQECTDKCKDFLWNAAHSPEDGASTLGREIFQQSLEQAGKMLIILDGFDEICPSYSPKVSVLIRAIKDKTASRIWVSSRFSHRQYLEDMAIKLAFTLQPFTPENQILFLEKYWTEIIRTSQQGVLRMFAKKLLIMCSQTFNDKDGDFTGVPLQTMMLGEAFVNEAEEYCSNGKFSLPAKFNLLALFRKFTEKKCDIYLNEKNGMDTSKPKAIREKESCLEKHMIPALMYLFCLDEVNQLLWKRNASNVDQAKEFLRKGGAEEIGIITDITEGNLQFIHRSFPEYFAAKWFAGNFKMCEDFISNVLFNPTYVATRNIFDRMLAEESEIHDAVLNNNIPAVEQFLEEKMQLNALDKGCRTALHLAASYNSPLTLKLLSVPGVDVNKPDAVLKWTPLRYADRTKSWMAMDILLQNGASADDIVLTRRNIEDGEWGEAALWECASKGHKKLLEFMLNCGTDVNAVVRIPENAQNKSTLLQRASFSDQMEVVTKLVDRGADINIRSGNNSTALHYAASSSSAEIIKFLLDKGMSVNLTNANDMTPLHVSAEFGNMEATKALVEGGAILNNTEVNSDTPLMVAAYHGKLEVVRYLTEIGADINIRDDKNNTALHFAAYSASVEIIKFLLDKGMSVNLTNADDMTPLHVSAECGNMEATKALVEGGAILNNTDLNGYTPLIVAAVNGKLEVVHYLTERGADINIRYDRNKTGLHQAAYRIKECLLI